jgi:hypothetical protein
MQRDVLRWIEHLYREIAVANGFTRIPEPYFTSISLADVTSLIQYAKDMLASGTISQDTAAHFYGTDFETENEQRKYEQANMVEQPVPEVPKESPIMPTDEPEEEIENPEETTR